MLLCQHSLLDMSCMEQGVDLPGGLSNREPFMTMLGVKCNYVLLFAVVFKTCIFVHSVDPEFSSTSVTLQEN